MVWLTAALHPAWVLYGEARVERAGHGSYCREVTRRHLPPKTAPRSERKTNERHMKKKTPPRLVAICLSAGRASFGRPAHPRQGIVAVSGFWMHTSAVGSDRASLSREPACVAGQSPMRPPACPPMTLACRPRKRPQAGKDDLVFRHEGRKKPGQGQPSACRPRRLIQNMLVGPQRQATS